MANYNVDSFQIKDNLYTIKTLYGICDTDAAIAQKVVDIPNAKVLAAGLQVIVKFKNGYSGASATLSLDVSGTGARPIKYKNKDLDSSLLVEGSLLSLLFDGSNWNVLGGVCDKIRIEDLGLTSYLNFKGVCTSLPQSGQNGDVVIIGHKEYIYANNTWHELGDESSYVLKEEGKQLSTNDFTDVLKNKLDGINTDDFVAKTRSISAGSGLTGGGALSSDLTISHADTSNQASITNRDRTYIQSITLDGFGHVTGMSSATEVVTDTHKTSKNIVGGTSTATENSSVSGNGVYLNHLEDSSVTSSHKISGSGKTTVTSNNGNIVIESSWPTIQNNLTSTQTGDALSAAQGKELKTQVDDKLSKSEGGTVIGDTTFSQNVKVNNSLSVNKVKMVYNSTDKCLDFVFSET